MGKNTNDRKLTLEEENRIKEQLEVAGAKIRVLIFVASNGTPCIPWADKDKEIVHKLPRTRPRYEEWK